MDEFEQLLAKAEKYPEPNVVQTHYNPPEEIFHLLHLAEASGIELPEIIHVWWEKETLHDWKACA